MKIYHLFQKLLNLFSLPNKKKASAGNTFQPKNSKFTPRENKKFVQKTAFKRNSAKKISEGQKKKPLQNSR